MPNMSNFNLNLNPNPNLNLNLNHTGLAGSQLASSLGASIGRYGTGLGSANTIANSVNNTLGGLSGFGSTSIKNSFNGIKDAGRAIFNNGLGDSFKDFFKDFKFGYLTDAASAIGSILGAVNAFKQSAMAEDMLEFQRDLANRNLGNQVKQINNQYDSNARIAAAFTGGTGGLSEAELRDKYLARAKEKHLDGTPI